jgi:hypothetical protein
VNSKLSQGRLAVVLFGVFLALLASRRWDQFASPQVWDEESWVIQGLIERGWREIFQPINGYLLIVPKLLLGAALAVSVYEFPTVAMSFTWVLTALIGVAVVFSPTHLKGRVLCALAIFAVPSDPEVFGIALYTFWWTAVLLFLLAVWDERAPALPLRSVYLLAGGLSSPVIVALLPVFYFRAYRYRAHAAEKWLAAGATVVAAVQFYFTRTVAAGEIPPLGSIAYHVIPKFLGSFLVGNLDENHTLAWTAGVGLLTLVIRGAWWDRRNATAAIIFFLLVAAVGLSVVRMDPAAPHPRWAGPRYFFFPYLMTFWALIQCLYLPQRKVAAGLAGAMLGLAVVNAVPAWARGVPQDDLRWTDHVRSAPFFAEYAVPIQFDGSRFRPWPPLRESRAVWEKVLGAPRLLPAAGQAARPTFAYRVLDAADQGPGVTPPGAVAAPTQMITIAPARAAGKRELRLRLKRGDRVYYKSGSPDAAAQMQVTRSEGVFIGELPLTAGWVTLEFSNSKLPPAFTLVVTDGGHGVGEWAWVEGPP